MPRCMCRLAKPSLLLVSKSLRKSYPLTRSQSDGASPDEKVRQILAIAPILPEGAGTGTGTNSSGASQNTTVAPQPQLQDTSQSQSSAHAQLIDLDSAGSVPHKQGQQQQQVSAMPGSNQQMLADMSAPANPSPAAAPTTNQPLYRTDTVTGSKDQFVDATEAPSLI
jgi:hypothetical protein